MSRHRLTFHLLTTDPEVARSAVADVARVVEEYADVVEQIADVRRGLGLTVGIVVFTGVRDVEADLFARAIRSLPGLPPMDSIRVKRLGR